MANKIVVMSQIAIDILKTNYCISGKKIVLIEHGVPDLQFSHEKSKKELQLENKKVLLTFGFISRNKGIETVIKALPRIIKNIKM